MSWRVNAASPLIVVRCAAFVAAAAPANMVDPAARVLLNEAPSPTATSTIFARCSARFGYDGDIVLTEPASIDEYGDWTVELPEPVGDTTYAINATCGDVTYEALQATSTTTSTSTSDVPQLTDPTVTATAAPPAAAAPATAQPGTSSYTG